MEVKEGRKGDRLVLAVSGRIDTNTTPELESYVERMPTDVKDLVIDLTDVQYVSSAGLRVILFAQKRMVGQGTLTISHPNEYVAHVFEATGMSDILTIEE
ncbi:MAG: STAS domain-containing protein [Atopobiaceae bacterium]|jgi:anti-sigma B factor antagonist|nr:STAS domain-containing protein [Atopobiaceae bacterium]